MSGDRDRVIPRTAGVAASADGIPIRFETTAPRDRALVLVHGWSCDRTYWRHQVAPFADDYQVVTLDLAGHGASGVGRAAWSMRAFGQDVAAVARALQLEDLVLVGHSMGGDVVVEAAQVLGAPVAGVVWVDVYTELIGTETPAELSAAVAPFEADFVAATRSFVRGMFPPTADPDLVEAIAADMAAAPPEIAIDALRHAWANEAHVMAALSKLTVPVVAINADYEPTDVASLGRFGIEAFIASDVGHFLMLEDPEPFDRLLAEVCATRFRWSRRPT